MVEVGVVAHAAGVRAPAPAEQHQPAALVARFPAAGRLHFVDSPKVPIHFALGSLTLARCCATLNCFAQISHSRQVVKKWKTFVKPASF